MALSTRPDCGTTALPKKTSAVSIGCGILIVAGIVTAGLATADDPNAAPDYRHISFRDFAVDGPDLASGGANVEVSGFYVRQGNVGVLYADETSAIAAEYGYGNSPPPTIPLLTNNASHQFREIQYSCDEALARGSVGCVLIVRGDVTTCDQTNMFGAES